MTPTIALTRLSYYTKRLDKLNKEKDKVSQKISNSKTDIIHIGSRKSRQKKHNQTLDKLDDEIKIARYGIAFIEDESLAKQGENLLRKITGVKVKNSEVQKLDVEYNSEKKEKKAQKKIDDKLETSKKTQKTIDDKLKTNKKTQEYMKKSGNHKSSKKVGDVLGDHKPNTTKISEAHIDEIKKLSKIDENILSELELIRENQIDEQDTTIKKTAPTGIMGLISGKKDGKGEVSKKDETNWLGGLIAGAGGVWLLDKIFDYLKNRIGDLAGKQAFIEIQKWTKGIKAGAGMVKIAEKMTAKQGAKMAAQAAAKAEVKAIVKAEQAAAKGGKKQVMKASNLVYKRIGKETTAEMADRIGKHILAKKATKLGLKKVPLAGGMIGLGFAYIRWKDGEYIKAAGEVLSIALAIFPGFGTAGSIGIDAALILSDINDIVEEIEAEEAKEALKKTTRAKGIKTIIQAQRAERIESQVSEEAKTNVNVKNAQLKADNALNDFNAYLASDPKSRDPKAFNTLRKSLSDSNAELQKELTLIRKKISNIDSSETLYKNALEMRKAEKLPEINALRQEQKKLLDDQKKNGTPETSGGYNKAKYEATQIKIKINATKLKEIYENIDKGASADVSEQMAPEVARATKAYDVANPQNKPSDTSIPSAGNSGGGTSPLLNQISKGEGTSRDGYNTTFAYGKYNPHNDKAVSKMTLGEIKQFQRGMITVQRQRGISKPKRSSAIGKWQFVQNTLKEVQSELGLSDDTIFDAKTQDKMIIHRLKKTRGYQSWMDGNMSDRDFQHALSEEFASIADPMKGGASHHGQHVGSTMAQMASAMKAEKAGSGILASSSTNIDNFVESSKSVLGVSDKQVKAPEVDKTGKEVVVENSSRNLVNNKGSYDKSGQSTSTKQIVSNNVSTNTNINSGEEDVNVMDMFSDKPPIDT